MGITQPKVIEPISHACAGAGFVQARREHRTVFKQDKRLNARSECRPRGTRLLATTPKHVAACCRDRSSGADRRRGVTFEGLASSGAQRSRSQSRALADSGGRRDVARVGTSRTPRSGAQALLAHRRFRVNGRDSEPGGAQRASYVLSCASTAPICFKGEPKKVAE